MKLQKKTATFGILTLLWTAVIFSFSLQPAEASASLSGGLLKHLLAWLHQFTGLQIPISFAHHLIRKTAHFLEFFLLGTLADATSRHLIQKWWPALCYGAIVAVTDEVIQHFTGSGRAMRAADMLLDTVGVAVAILLWNTIVKIRTARKNKNTKTTKNPA